MGNIFSVHGAPFYSGLRSRSSVKLREWPKFSTGYLRGGDIRSSKLRTELLEQTPQCSVDTRFSPWKVTARSPCTENLLPGTFYRLWLRKFDLQNLPWRCAIICWMAHEVGIHWKSHYRGKVIIINGNLKRSWCDKVKKLRWIVKRTYQLIAHFEGRLTVNKLVLNNQH